MTAGRRRATLEITGLLLLAALVVAPAVALSLLAMSSLRGAQTVYERQMREAFSGTADSLIERASDALEARGAALDAVTRAFAAEMTAENRLALAGDGLCAAVAVIDRGWRPLYPLAPSTPALRARADSDAAAALLQAAAVEAAQGSLAAIPLYEDLIERLSGEDAPAIAHARGQALCGLARTLSAAQRAEEATAALERLAGEPAVGGDLSLPLFARYRLWKTAPSPRTAAALLDACLAAALHAPDGQLRFYLDEVASPGAQESSLVAAALNAASRDRAFASAAVFLVPPEDPAATPGWAWRNVTLGADSYLYGTVRIPSGDGAATAVVLVDADAAARLVEPLFAAAVGAVSFEFGADPAAAGAAAGQTVAERTFPEPFSAWTVRAVASGAALEDLAKNRVRLMSWAAALTGLLIILGAASVFVWARRRMALARLQTDFVANVTHELKTPLTGIKSLAETLALGRVTSQEKSAEFLAAILRETDRLSRLIASVLDLARLERGPSAPRAVVDDLADVVRAAVASFQASLPPGEEASVGCVAPAAFPALIDRDAITGVILNLLDNAWKYSHPPRDVRVRLDAGDAGAVISVSDNGVGLSPADTRRVFRKFYRANASLAADTQGVGLGLTLAKAAVEAHGGTIRVESRRGAGSTFTVTLPLAREDRR